MFRGINASAQWILNKCKSTYEPTYKELIINDFEQGLEEASKKTNNSFSESGLSVLSVTQMQSGNILYTRYINEDNLENRVAKCEATRKILESHIQTELHYFLVGRTCYTIMLLPENEDKNEDISGKIKEKTYSEKKKRILRIFNKSIV